MVWASARNTDESRVFVGGSVSLNEGGIESSRKKTDAGTRKKPGVRGSSDERSFPPVEMGGERHQRRGVPCHRPWQSSWVEEQAPR